jgi:hypothetical protein
VDWTDLQHRRQDTNCNELAKLVASLFDSGGFFCPFSGNTSTTTGTYDGNRDVTGSSALSVD